MDELQDFRNPLRLCVKQIVSRDLISMARAEEKSTANAPIVQAQFRQRIKALLIANIVLGIVLTSVIATAFYWQIVKRLQTTIDNSRRFASRRPLNSPTKGADEISEVDEAFHQMATAVAEAEQREIALIEHSLDVICSLDSMGRFVDVNPAGKQAFGYHGDELLRMNARNVIFEDDIEHFKNSLSTAMEKNSAARFETRIKHTQGKVTELDWSIRWVPSMQLFFCVGHDISERKEVERLKQRFMAMISHDLRTPLSVMKNYIEMSNMGMCGQLSERGEQLIKIADLKCK